MIVITGMHRSGTSLAANLLSELGMDFGNRSLLISADKWNSKGYYENREVVGLNNSMLVGSDFGHWVSGRTVSRARVALAKARYMLFPGRGVGRRARVMEGDIENLLDKYRGVAVKDPRFSLTLGEWMRRGGVEKVLYCYRNPFEVAMSLKKRDSVPLWLGYRMWSYHVREFLGQSKGAKLTVVDYNRLFSEGKEMERLYAFAGKVFDSRKARALLEKVLDRRLRHNKHSGQGLPETAGRLYSVLGRMHSKHSLPKEFAGWDNHKKM